MAMELLWTPTVLTTNWFVLSKYVDFLKSANKLGGGSEKGDPLLAKVWPLEYSVSVSHFVKNVLKY